MSRDWKNFFTAEDFTTYQGSVSSHSHYYAAHANKLIREAIEGCPRVYGKIQHEREVWAWDDQPGGDDTHTARLIDIREINSEVE